MHKDVDSVRKSCHLCEYTRREMSGDSDGSDSLIVCVYVDAIHVCVCVTSERMCLLAQLYPTDMQQVT